MEKLVAPKNCLECPRFNSCDSYYGGQNCSFNFAIVRKQSFFTDLIRKFKNA